MNRHPYPFTGKNKAIWTNAVQKMKCTRCGSDPMFHCERLPPAKTAGAKRWPPHSERVKALFAATPGGVQAFALRATVGPPVHLIANGPHGKKAS